MKEARSHDVEQKESCLRALFRSLGSAIVAYSGGVDSAYVAFIAACELGEKMLAVTAESPSLAARQREEAIAFAQRFAIPHLLIRTEELRDPNYRRNPPNRCYYCKRELYARLTQLARERGFRALCDGANMDDLADFRPGRHAAREFGVISPLIECRITKAEVRELSRRHGLPTWDKPASPCLASRIPYGMEVTPEKLRAIEQGEEILRDLGFRIFRVRHHGALVRLELGAEELRRALHPETLDRVVREFKALGFTFVTLDLEGYRTGALNEVLPFREETSPSPE